MIYLDSSSIASFLQCREEFRLKYLHDGTGIMSKWIAIHREAGIAVHKAIELFWLGRPFEDALAVALEYMQSIPLSSILPKELDKWKELQDKVPDMIAAYYDTQEQSIDRVLFLEHQFRYDYSLSACIIGRIDRVMCSGGTILVDLKTATQFGSERSWKRDYKETALRDFQLPLYDWYLCQIGQKPDDIKLEVLIKPNERYGQRARVIEIPLPEIIAYRSRTTQQIEQIVSAVVSEVGRGSEKFPWLMASSNICSGKFGPCPYLPLCNYGLNERQLNNYVSRVEHLTNITRRIE